MADISQALSRATILDAIAAPTVTDLEREAGAETILALLMYELEKVNRMFNSNERLKLTHEQCADIAVLILDEFPHEALEDFVLAFRRGITGRYDEKLLRLDVQVIFRWVRCWLDEKAERAETYRKEEKQVETQPYTPEERERIAKIVNDSWVGQALKEQKQDEENFMRFKARYMTRKSAENASLPTPPPEADYINPDDNGQD